MTPGSTPPSKNLPLNILKNEWDSETMERWQGKVVLSPEDYIGATYVENGTHYRIDSILGQGASATVFAILNLDTGKSDTALKIFHFFFDQESVLEEGINDAMRNVSSDPDRAIWICDQLLELDPNNGIAAFDKAVALAVKGELEQALEWYDVAIAANPSDALNWLDKAATLAKLDRHIEATEHFSMAASLDHNNVRTFLGQVKPKAKILESSLKQALRYNPKSEDARRALDEFFVTDLPAQDQTYQSSSSTKAKGATRSPFLKRLWHWLSKK